MRAEKVVVLGHRGASGYRPEHTLASYRLAVEQGADYIEPDLVPTRDGVVVARHENEIGGTTDVADHPELAGRHTTKIVDGLPVTGWFTEDLTYAELGTLRARERIPGTRPGSTAYDGQLAVPTFAEILELATSTTTRTGGRVGVAPEIKHGMYFESIGLPMTEVVVATLADHGFAGAADPVVIQSFETGNLRELSRMTEVRLVQLVAAGAPHDLVAAGDPRTYADLVTSEGLREISSYAAVLGADKHMMIPRTADGVLGAPTSLVRDAHRAGLDVYGWTFRAENAFLPAELRFGADRRASGDLAAEIHRYLALGMDGLFADQPDLAVAAVAEFEAARGH